MMSEFEIKEQREGQLDGILADSIDPRYRRAVEMGLHQLAKISPRGAAGKLEDWAYMLMSVVNETLAISKEEETALAQNRAKMMFNRSRGSGLGGSLITNSEGDTSK